MYTYKINNETKKRLKGVAASAVRYITFDDYVTPRLGAATPAVPATHGTPDNSTPAIRVAAVHAVTAYMAPPHWNTPRYARWST